jgi:hypothetical protein
MQVGGVVLVNLMSTQKGSRLAHSHDAPPTTPCTPGCDRGYHTFCLGLHEIPTGEWFCTECTRARARARGRDVRAVASRRQGGQQPHQRRVRRRRVIPSESASEDFDVVVVSSGEEGRAARPAGRRRAVRSRRAASNDDGDYVGTQEDEGEDVRSDDDEEDREAESGSSSASGSEVDITSSDDAEDEEAAGGSGEEEYAEPATGTRRRQRAAAATARRTRARRAAHSTRRGSSARPRRRRAAPSSSTRLAQPAAGRTGVGAEGLAAGEVRAHTVASTRRAVAEVFRPWPAGRPSLRMGDVGDGDAPQPRSAREFVRVLVAQTALLPETRSEARLRPADERLRLAEAQLSRLLARHAESRGGVRLRGADRTGPGLRVLAAQQQVTGSRGAGGSKLLIVVFDCDAASVHHRACTRRHLLLKMPLKTSSKRSTSAQTCSPHRLLLLMPPTAVCGSAYRSRRSRRSALALSAATASRGPCLRSPCSACGDEATSGGPTRMQRDPVGWGATAWSTPWSTRRRVMPSGIPWLRPWSGRRSSAK